METRDMNDALSDKVRKAVALVDFYFNDGAKGTGWPVVRDELLRLADENARLSGRLCLVCGLHNDSQCPQRNDERSPCTFDPSPVEAAKAFFARATKAEAELAEMKQSSDLRWKADMRAIDHWRREHPGDDLTWPDHADLCVWLMGELAALRELHKVTCESAAANARELAALKVRIAESARVQWAGAICGENAYAEFKEPREGYQIYAVVALSEPPAEYGEG